MNFDTDITIIRGSVEQVSLYKELARPEDARASRMQSCASLVKFGKGTSQEGEEWLSMSLVIRRQSCALKITKASFSC